MYFSPPPALTICFNTAPQRALKGARSRLHNGKQQTGHFKCVYNQWFIAIFITLQIQQVCAIVFFISSSNLTGKQLLFVDSCIQSFSVFLFNFTFDKMFPKKPWFPSRVLPKEPDCYIRWAQVLLMSTNQIQEDSYFVVFYFDYEISPYHIKIFLFS